MYGVSFILGLIVLLSMFFFFSISYLKEKCDVFYRRLVWKRFGNIYWLLITFSVNRFFLFNR